MKQVIFGGTSVNLDATATEYDRVIGGAGWTGTRTNRLWEIQGGFTVRNLRIELENAPGAGNSFVFTLMDGSSGTVVTVTISDTATSGEDTTHSHAYVTADDITLRVNPSGTPTVGNATWSFELEGGTSNEAYWGTDAGGNQHDNTATEYNSVFANGRSWGTVENEALGLVALDGTVTEFRVQLNASPGAGNSYTYQIRVNGTPQGDSFVISDSATSGVITGQVINIAPGDTITVQVVPAGTPTVRKPWWGMVYTPDIDGESNIAGYTNNNTNATVTEYNGFTGAGSSWTADEASKVALANGAGAPDWTLRDFRVEVDVAAGAGDEYVFTVRKNQAAGNSVVTISGASEVADVDAVNTDVFTSGDEIDIRHNPGGSPATTDSRWAAIQFISVAAGISIPVVYHHRQRNF